MTERKGCAVLRFEAGAAGREDKPDAPVWVHVATAGTFNGYAGGEQPFTFDSTLFAQVVANFRRSPAFRLGPDGVGVSNVIAWDFHHASEMPASAVGRDGAPAQGWIQDLKVRTGADGKAQLWALTRWLEPARSYIKDGRYQWASVSILFDAVDAVSGQRMGPTLTSVAITNQPFIEGMQPLAASRNAPAHPKEQTMATDSKSLEARIITRARELRATTPTVALALSTATAELMPNASNDERHRVWAPLLKNHNLESVRHAVSNGAQLTPAKHAGLWHGRREAERQRDGVVAHDTRPTIDVSTQHGPNPFAKLLAHVKATNPTRTHADCTEIAMQLNRSHRIIAA